MNSEAKQRIEEAVAYLESKGRHEESRHVRAILAEEPPPQSARERLLTVLPKHTEEPVDMAALARCLSLLPDDISQTVIGLVNTGVVEMVDKRTGAYRFRLAPPVEGVDVDLLEAVANGIRPELRSILRKHITALRRRQDQSEEIAKLRASAEIYGGWSRWRSGLWRITRSDTGPSAAWIGEEPLPALDVSEVEAVAADLEATPVGFARQYGAKLRTWLASRPKAEPVNTELLEAARAWKWSYNDGSPIDDYQEKRKALLAAIARADAASKATDSSCKPGENCQKPDPAARPATEPWVRELVARSVEHPGGMKETAAAIRAGDCDPKPGKAQGGEA